MDIMFSLEAEVVVEAARVHLQCLTPLALLLPMKQAQAMGYDTPFALIEDVAGERLNPLFFLLLNPQIHFALPPDRPLIGM